MSLRRRILGLISMMMLKKQRHILMKDNKQLKRQVSHYSERGNSAANRIKDL